MSKKEPIDIFLPFFSKEEIKDILDAEKSEPFSGFPSNMKPISKRAKRRSSKDEKS